MWCRLCENMSLQLKWKKGCSQKFQQLRELAENLQFPHACFIYNKISTNNTINIRSRITRQTHYNCECTKSVYMWWAQDQTTCVDYENTTKIITQLTDLHFWGPSLVTNQKEVTLSIDNHFLFESTTWKKNLNACAQLWQSFTTTLSA